MNGRLPKEVRNPLGQALGVKLFRIRDRGQEAAGMKALEVIEETDPKGTVVGVRGVVDLRDKSRLTLWYLVLAAVIFIMVLLLLHISAPAVV